MNRQIKEWKYFSQTIQNSSLPFISDYLDIVCAMINAFGSRPITDIHAGAEVASRMLEASNESNHTQGRLSAIARERAEWKRYDAQMCLFPELDEDDLKDLCFGMKVLFLQKKLSLFLPGSYQIKQAVSYIKEHLKPSVINDDEFEFEVELCSKYENLVRARFTSRHSKSKTYITIIQHNSRSIRHPIEGWYCTCVTGCRDVGCCAHVAALLWHLGVCRAEVNQQIHPLSTTAIFSSINDSLQFFDMDDSDDEMVDDSSGVYNTD